MAQFPYVYNVSKLKSLLTKIHQVGVPTKADNKWLSSIGFASSNDRSILVILKFIGFLDPAGTPADAWREYRGPDSRSVLGNAVKAGYEEVFSTYPDAHQRPDAELKSFFKSRSQAGEDAITKTLATFKSLCELSDFADAVGSARPGKAMASAAAQQVPQAAVDFRETAAPPVTINVNIQLSLPETKDEEVYDHFFAALKRHLVDSRGAAS